jgi:dimethylhistidine N-methyltransferase
MQNKTSIHIEMPLNFPLYEGDSLNIAAVQGGIAVDTLLGLSSEPKYLLPKYLYDDAGSALFGEIMKMPEYYLTRCEFQILTGNAEKISGLITRKSESLNIIEPGSGDGSKTIILLEALRDSGLNFRFIPVDISSAANETLKKLVISVLPGTDVRPETGDYFDILKNLKTGRNERNLILFLGSNIGNLDNKELDYFLSNLSELTTPGDMLLIGFDLKKSPGIIIRAYDDPLGLTARFILNHLVRLNKELDADFDISGFEYHTGYNPVSGELKSYLVSTARQVVHVGALGEVFFFKKWEPIYMELSRKFDVGIIESLAVSHNFRIVENFTDSNNWFIDSLWSRI